MRAKGISESPARVEFTVQFSHGPKGRRRAHEASEQSDLTQATGPAASPSNVSSAGSVPKITRLLVLGHHFERLVHQTAVKDYAEIARLTGLTRARVTQIVNLTLLAPEIQMQILSGAAVPRHPGSLSERLLRPLAAEASWKGQLDIWVGLRFPPEVSLRRRATGQKRSVAAAL